MQAGLKCREENICSLENAHISSRESVRGRRELTGATAVMRLISPIVPPVKLETKSSFWDFREGAMFVEANTLRSLVGFMDDGVEVSIVSSLKFERHIPLDDSLTRPWTLSDTP